MNILRYLAIKYLRYDLYDVGTLYLDILVMSMIPCTDTAGPEVTTETFVTWMLNTLDQLADKDHGIFLRCDNTSVPW